MHISRILFFGAMLAACFLPAPAGAQAPASLQWGPDYNEPNNTVATKIVGIVPEGFYLLRRRVSSNANARPRAWVEFFTKDMKLQRSEEMELKYKGKQRDFEEVLLLGGRMYLLTSFHNTARKRNYLFKQELSMKTLAPSKNLDMICENEARNIEAKGKFAFHISSDSTKLLVYNELPFEKKNPKRFGFRVFDQNFDLLWEKNIVMPYPDNQFTVEDYRVDDEGNVYLLGVLYEDEVKWRRRGKPTYKYLIIAYTEQGNDVEEYRIDGENRFITDLTFRPAKNGTLVCAGFYSERGTYSVKGATYFRLDTKTRRFYDWNYQPFTFDFLTEFMSEKNKTKAKEAEVNNDVRRAAELYDYSLDELILRSDGGAVLVAEQFFIEQDVYRDYPMGFYPWGFYDPFFYNRYGRVQTDYWFHYNDIIVVNIRPTGEIEWAARIPKRQETRNDGGYNSSYAMSIVRDKLFFIFNDNMKNHTGPSGQRPSRYYSYGGGEGMLVLAQVNKDGEVSTYPMSSNRDAGVIVRPKMSKQIGRREMAVFGERGRSFRAASLNFD